MMGNENYHSSVSKKGELKAIKQINTGNKSKEIRFSANFTVAQKAKIVWFYRFL